MKNNWQPCRTTILPTALLNDDAHVYVVNLDTITIDTTMLNSTEQIRISKMRPALQQQRSQKVRTILRCLLSHYTQVAADHLNFETKEYGKLYLPDQSIQFNVAHAHEYALYAFTLNDEIGIDIEEQRSIEYAAIAQRIMSPNEYAYWTECDSAQQAELFFQIWTRKEALVKCTGDGLRMPLKNLNTLTETRELQTKINYIDQQHLWLSDLPSLAKVIEKRAFYAAAASAKPVAYHCFQLQD